VIFVADKTRPSDEMVTKGFDANPSGAGIAWRQDGLVFWEKGLDVEEVKEYARTMPLPYVLHFRIPSCGDSSQALCHPFPIDIKAPLDLSGKTKGSVLFHNGHWGQWKAMGIEASVRRNVKIPGGKWTDTRAMAWIAAHYGTGILEFIDEKAVVMSVEDVEIFGSGWSKINDLWCSNSGWQTGGRHNAGYQGWQGSSMYGHGGSYIMCRERSCTETRLGTSDYCTKHQSMDPTQAKVNGSKESGGTPSQEEKTFRNGATPEKQGATKPDTIQEGSPTVQEGDEAARQKAISAEASKELMILDSRKLAMGEVLPPAEDWRSLRRWVRSLNHKTSIHEADEAVDRAKRRSELAAGMRRIGPI